MRRRRRLKRLGIPGSLARERDARVVALFVVVVGALTVVGSWNADVADALAASPARLAQGRIWLLVSSGLLAERPVGASIVSFALLAALALVVCGRRIFWWAAVAGHVGSAVVIYAVIGLARLSEPGAFSSVFRARDYGVSAVSAAWLGAIATVGWRVRSNSATGRLAIALSCIAVGLFAYSARPGLTIIAGEHVLAFALGIAIAATLVRPVTDLARLRHLRALLTGGPTAARSRLPRPIRGLDPVVLAAVAVAAAVVGGAAMPSALAALGETISRTPPPSVGRCVAAWNHAPAGHRLGIHDAPAVVAAGYERRTSATRRQARPEFCSYIFTGRNRRATEVVGRWHHGRIVSWRSRVAKRGEVPTNAVADASGVLELAVQRHR